MDTPTLISLVAVVVGLGSLFAARSSAKISHRALEHAIEVHEKSERKEHERAKADLLNQIADSRATIDTARVAIGTERANFGALPPAVRAMLETYQSSLFEDYYSRLEQAVEQLDQLWEDVASWSPSAPYGQLMHARAVLHRARADDERTSESGMYMLGEYQKRLPEAREKVLSAKKI